MIAFIKKNKFILVGVIIGAVCGYLYYYFVGCANGTCAITSDPLKSTVYGAILGGLTLNIFK
ncbi:MAG: hypothetical protein JSS85_06995 [Bacteroidetes bacterium]|nr:hypothetical protein [Bacteroidota bacterium]